jgi:hypothetical protein
MSAAAAGRIAFLCWLVGLLSVELALGSAAAQDHQRAPVPGAVDARVTQATIHETICQRGYTARVRPPRKVTDGIKRRLAVGLPGSPRTMSWTISSRWVSGAIPPLLTISGSSTLARGGHEGPG